MRQGLCPSQDLTDSLYAMYLEFFLPLLCKEPGSKPQKWGFIDEWLRILYKPHLCEPTSGSPKAVRALLLRCNRLSFVAVHIVPVEIHARHDSYSCMILIFKENCDEKLKIAHSLMSRIYNLGNFASQSSV